jgi:hypothetical protein
MVWETVPRNYFFIFFSPLEVTVFFLHSLIAQKDLCISLRRILKRGTGFIGFGIYANDRLGCCAQGNEPSVSYRDIY